MTERETPMAEHTSGREDARDISRPEPPAGATIRHVRSAELFGASREVVIQHDHHVYRLKQTSRGGLILTK
ncbi:MAG: hemin uptake protein HemP [Dongiaceae bacterium]